MMSLTVKHTPTSGEHSSTQTSIIFVLYTLIFLLPVSRLRKLGATPPPHTPLLRGPFDTKEHYVVYKQLHFHSWYSQHKYNQLQYFWTLYLL